MTPRAARSIGITLALLGVIGLAVSIPVMAQKLASRGDLEDRPVFWFAEPAGEYEFAFRGEPISITLAEPETGNPSLDLTFRGNRLVFPIGPDDDPRLPGLNRHSKWFKVLPMAAAPSGSRQDLMLALADGSIEPRLVVAARYPAEGYDPESWGRVRRKEWRYRFVELKVDGPPEEAVESVERTYGELDALYSPSVYDDPESIADAETRRRDGWQYEAMLQVTPAGAYRSRSKRVRAGMTAMGWTWPAAGVSILLFLGGSALAAASRIPRPPPPSPPSPPSAAEDAQRPESG